MRQIEKQMLAAIAAGQNWMQANTQVTFTEENVADVYLHGNHIARIRNGELTVNEETLAAWPTPTTKSRLRALGANVTTRNYVTYLNGEEV